VAEELLDLLGVGGATSAVPVSRRVSVLGLALEQVALAGALAQQLAAARSP
jgi:hypothetical protein